MLTLRRRGRSIRQYVDFFLRGGPLAVPVVQAGAYLDKAMLFRDGRSIWPRQVTVFFPDLRVGATAKSLSENSNHLIFNLNSVGLRGREFEQI